MAENLIATESMGGGVGVICLSVLLILVNPTMVLRAGFEPGRLMRLFCVEMSHSNAECTLQPFQRFLMYNGWLEMNIYQNCNDLL